ncbi:formimidoylglutamate deiminase [Rathayibacter sp. VKM Ac-2803]|uniref:formimidoylglutamate deiminase n=1 Tax=unclassified Rathayibacter TaxID=2609250 RepID=UPI0013572EA7|nr:MULTISPECIES: formimidoylglutamate deiminase [unclassified Rathayibacter]MWV48572.1 formimidoylglutamate deiminase [Rathayibacter sp. VKM Ac-2803]MWV60090.1 formimidoylglutamate deiminase [Rathayibacter sp. VKM Ac-2754]
MTAFWCERAVVDGVPRGGVRIVSESGVVAAVEPGADPRPGDHLLGTVAPGFANAHSHLFHRALRGRTHGDGGDFWRWRDEMYAVAGVLDPSLYRSLARAVFSEMVAAGYTAVGEFHYVHHRPGGEPYGVDPHDGAHDREPEHAMERAVADAAADAGIRLTLLDTLYLGAGIGRGLDPDQRRFGDRGAAGWLERWHRLRTTLADRPGLLLGAAIHSVRAVPEREIAALVAGLPAEVPLHIHLSEQPRENEECLAATGLTPTGLLARAGALSDRLSVVHATHLTEGDHELLGAAGVAVVMCPSTEADLGDGIGPARALADRGASLAVGSDQNAVVDPMLELRGLEAGERLNRGRRGVLSPAELWRAGTVDGYASLGWHGGIRVGAVCDLVEIEAASMRTLGAPLEALPLVATAADVLRTVVGGRVIDTGITEALLAQALGALDAARSAATPSSSDLPTRGRRDA